MNESFLFLVAFAAIALATMSIRSRNLQRALRPIRVRSRQQNRRSR